MVRRDKEHFRVEPTKRLFDIGLSLLLLTVLSPAILVISLLVLLVDGRPVIYPAQRMKTPRKRFTLWKFRTMQTDASRHEVGVSGGDKQHRITRLGRFLRRTRLDELPQLANVLIGDISFVGPRPPAPRYVKRYREIYTEVLQCRPGITGLATVMFHSHEEMLLAQTSTAAETERIYVTRCIPRKARLDLIYRDNWSLGLDLYILYLTAGKMLPLPLPGRRLNRLKAKAMRVAH